MSAPFGNYSRRISRCRPVERDCPPPGVDCLLIDVIVVILTVDRCVVVTDDSADVYTGKGWEGGYSNDVHGCKKRDTSWLTCQASCDCDCD